MRKNSDILDIVDIIWGICPVSSSWRTNGPNNTTRVGLIESEFKRGFLDWAETIDTLEPTNEECLYFMTGERARRLSFWPGLIVQAAVRKVRQHQVSHVCVGMWISGLHWEGSPFRWLWRWAHSKRNLLKVVRWLVEWRGVEMDVYLVDLTCK